MAKKITSILDFGSSQLTMLVGYEEVNNSFRLLASVDMEYEGFNKGKFIEPNNLKSAITELVNKVERELQFNIDSLFVGVPAEFCFVYDTMLTRTFVKKTKVTNKLIDSIFLDDNEDTPYQTHTIINKAPLFFIINDDNKSNDPVGLIANKLQARTGYVLVDNNFKGIVSNILKSIGIKQFDFICSSLAEGMYLVDEHKRNEGAILVDCGHITTSVSLVLGAGLKELKSFSLGGAFITSDLSRLLEIPYEEAEELKRDIILTLKPNGTDFYTSSSGKRFSVKNVNEIVLARIDKIVEMINKCIGSFEMQLPNYIPIYLTGGGLNYIEGISDYFRHTIDRKVELISPKALLYRKPDLSSSISVFNMAMNI